MARTAPVPNIPPIPGMCPGIAVLAGGGGSGGSGGKGAGAGGGGVGAGGEGGAGETEGDGRGGSGSGACGCPMCNAGATRGDPVDVVTGRAFTEPHEDIFLPGPLPLTVMRTYSSTAARRDVGLGFGWSHSLAWQVVVRRRALHVHTGDGRRFVLPVPQVGEELLGPEGWVVRRERWGYLIDIGDDCWRAFSEVDQQGKRYRLTAIEDINKNRISLVYEDGVLATITDSVGREIRVKRDASGRILELAVKNAPAQGRWHTLASYGYDAHGRMLSYSDAIGSTTTFEYESHNLLTRYRLPTGLSFHFVYDAQRRCVETWGDYDGRADPALAASAPKLLADGVTPAKGILHVKLTFAEDGYSEVANSISVERFFGNGDGRMAKAILGGGVTSRARDDRGHVVALTDPFGYTTRWERDPRGRVTRRVDALERVLEIERDAHGKPIGYRDHGGGTVSISRDARGNILTITNQLQGVFAFKHTDNGMIAEMTRPNGGKTTLAYDGHCNPVEVVEADGGRWRATYDWLGRRTSITDPLGSTTRFTYDDRGDLIAVTRADGAVTRYSHDGARNLIRVVDPDGTWVELTWGAYHKHCDIHKPDGRKVALRYDRECRLVEVHNERGEVQRFDYNSLGRKTKETTFDGRTLSYVYDLTGQLTRFVNGAGERSDFVYDPLGRLIERTYDDGSIETFEYDARGNLARAVSPSAEVTYERDALGRVTREVQVAGGQAHECSRAYDAWGVLPIRRASSLSLNETVKRNARGQRELTTLGPAAIEHRRDLLGRETRRTLPRGGLLESTFDPLGRLVSRTARSPGAAKELPVAWIGAIAPDATAHRGYGYNLAGDVVTDSDPFRESVELEYDPLGRVLAATRGSQKTERYFYDETDNIHDAGDGAPTRAYGPGNVLQACGSTTYTHDDDARLIDKRVRLDDGGEARWTYHWSTRGDLVAVERPDDVRIQLGYDAVHRLVSKSVLRRPAPGAPHRQVSTTRLVWDGDTLLHELTQWGEQEELRTYWFEDASFKPWAERHETKSGGHDTQSAWLFHLNDPAGAPEELLDEVCRPLGHHARGAWQLNPTGASGTRLRFQGQLADDDIGLVYNRYRFFDPELVRFVSPDPVGLEGGANVFRAPRNPLGYFDPWGLTISAVTEDLAAAMSDDGRPIGTEHQAHHVVPREDSRGSAGAARDLCDSLGIGRDEACNGARLMGRHATNVSDPDHPGRGCAGYHGTRSDGTGSPHSASAYDTVHRRISAAAGGAGADTPANRDARAAAVRTELRTIGSEMENGTWMTDADRAAASS